MVDGRTLYGSSLSARCRRRLAVLLRAGECHHIENLLNMVVLDSELPFSLARVTVRQFPEQLAPLACKRLSMVHIVMLQQITQAVQNAWAGMGVPNLFSCL